jgi:dimeric dUTPase (all-alpha-NTP-PPase superfamily)
MDKLDKIFELQKGLQEKLGNTNILYNQPYLNLNFLAITCELMEAMAETQWKNPTTVSFGWKISQEFHKEKLQEELVDVFHFYVNLCLAAGLTPQDLFLKYMDKNKINHERKETNY